MNGWLDTLTLWHWLALGLLLLLADRLVVRGYLMGAALAALLVSLVLLAGPTFSWAVQVFLFATFAVVFSLLYRRRPQQSLPESVINQEPDANALVGRVFQLDHSLPLGHGTLRAEGQSWPVHCSEPLSPGRRVKVIGVEGLSLKVIPLEE